MNDGTTYIEINYDEAWVNSSINALGSWRWLYEWGMYLFLLVAAAIVFWIFFDSITKKKDQKALVPRIMAMIGFFAIIPAFIFRFTGNADGVHTLVKLGLNADPAYPYMRTAVNWNVNWLVNGYGPTIAIIALVGMLLSVAALVIYASTVQRAKPSTEFVRAFNSKMDSLENKVEDAKRNAAAANAAAANASSAAVNAAKVSAASAASASAARQASAAPAARPAANATIIDRTPQAATIIDVPKTGDTLTIQAGSNRGNTYDLPANDFVIGREAKCYIVVDDGKVSREHVKFVYTSGSWSALDMGSVNGTYINGQRLSGQQQLNNGDTVKIGDTILVFGKAAH